MPRWWNFRRGGSNVALGPEERLFQILLWAGGGEEGSGPAHLCPMKGPRSASPPDGEKVQEHLSGMSFRGSQDVEGRGGWGRPSLPTHGTGILSWKPCKMSAGLPAVTRGSVASPKCREGQARWPPVAQMAAAPVAPSYVRLNGWAPPTSSESQECCHLATHSLISLAFLRIAGTRGVGVLRTPGDSGNVSLPPQIAGSQSWTGPLTPSSVKGKLRPRGDRGLPEVMTSFLVQGTLASQPPP